MFKILTLFSAPFGPKSEGINIYIYIPRQSDKETILQYMHLTIHTLCCAISPLGPKSEGINIHIPRQSGKENLYQIRFSPSVCSDHPFIPRPPQESPRAPQEIPRTSQEAPRIPQEAPRTPQEAPRSTQRALSPPQDPQEDPKASHETPKGIQETP